MTNEEAKKNLKEWFDNDGIGEIDAVDFILALNALEKQIPKKPINIVVTEYKVSYECPICGTKHVNEWCGTNWKLPFCSICGQAFSWEDWKDIE